MLQIMIFYNIYHVLLYYFRPFIKWFLRKTTRLCELQRICYGENPGAARNIKVEQSLTLSRTREIREAVSYLDAVILEKKFVSTNFESVFDPAINIIVKVKNINVKAHNRFIVSIRKSLEDIWSYKQLLNDVEDLRKTHFDCEDPEHEKKLVLLWSLLMPNEPLENRITKQWQDIGFQGDDPKTDFRGMGLLGLENLLYFASEYSLAASHVLSHSHHPQYGYTFAVVGINLTSMAYHLLKNGPAKTYMYNYKHSFIDISLFHKMYCYLFYEFDKLWMESKPKNMMEFSVIFEQFESIIKDKMADPASVFRINLKIDTI